MIEEGEDYLTVRVKRVMGRYRPPPPPRSNYITPEGAATLERELDALWRIKRPQVTRAVAEAAAQGDRSENAEYIYGKKQLAEIDRRVRHLRRRLRSVRVVDRLPAETRKVYFGAWIELENPRGEVKRFRLVGPDEFDHAPGYLSIDSPLGKAVLGKTVDDAFRITTPEGAAEWTLIGVSYGGVDE
jgi:transcription elongation factor GreB